MRVYIPVLDNIRRCESCISGELRQYNKSSIRRWKEGVGFYGLVYSNNIFLSAEDVARYWRRDPVKSYTLAEIQQLAKTKAARQ